MFQNAARSFLESERKAMRLSFPRLSRNVWLLIVSNAEDVRGSHLAISAKRRPPIDGENESSRFVDRGLCGYRLGDWCSGECEVVMVDSVVADSVAVDLKFVKPWVGYHLRTGDSSFRNTFRIKGKQGWANGKEEVRY